MTITPNTMVGLKYTGKKIPFKFENPKLIGGEMAWKDRGDVIQVPYQDALILTIGSGNDFAIIYPGYVEPTTKKPRPIDPEDHNDEMFAKNDDSLDAPLFADEANDERPAKRGRPKKS